MRKTNLSSLYRAVNDSIWNGQQERNWRITEAKTVSLETATSLMWVAAVPGKTVIAWMTVLLTDVTLKIWRDWAPGKTFPEKPFPHDGPYFLSQLRGTPLDAGLSLNWAPALREKQEKRGIFADGTYPLDERWLKNTSLLPSRLLKYLFLFIFCCAVITYRCFVFNHYLRIGIHM